MTFTLIFTVILYTNTSYEKTPVHIEHDYPTLQACHQAYQIAREQFSGGDPRLMVERIAGTCLKTSGG